MARAYVEIPLGGKKSAGRVALVDIDDYGSAIGHRWSVYEKTASNGSVSGPYAITNISRDGHHTTIYLHKLLTGWPMTDHDDHDGLNNTRTNLRLATSKQNGANRRLDRGPKSSRYKGVTWHKKARRWVAQIRVDGKIKHLGYFLEEAETALAYNSAATAAFGEFAFINQAVI